jgi:hypothetical protein
MALHYVFGENGVMIMTIKRKMEMAINPLIPIGKYFTPATAPLTVG